MFTEVEAPIVQVDIGTAESWPLQHFAWITAGLPNGCHIYSRAIDERLGARITVTVLNRVPMNLKEWGCDMRWREHAISVALGTDFTSGDPCVVIVNGEPHAFIGQ